MAIGLSEDMETIAAASLKEVGTTLTTSDGLGNHVVEDLGLLGLLLFTRGEGLVLTGLVHGTTRSLGRSGSGRGGLVLVGLFEELHDWL
jgi:hypothetical protein